MCIYECVGGCHDKYISIATWPPEIKISGSGLVYWETKGKKKKQPKKMKMS